MVSSRCVSVDLVDVSYFCFPRICSFVMVSRCYAVADSFHSSPFCFSWNCLFVMVSRCCVPLDLVTARHFVRQWWTCFDFTFTTMSRCAVSVDVVAASRCLRRREWRRDGAVGRVVSINIWCWVVLCWLTPRCSTRPRKVLRWLTPRCSSRPRKVLCWLTPRRSTRPRKTCPLSKAYMCVRACWPEAATCG